MELEITDEIVGISAHDEVDKENLLEAVTFKSSVKEIKRAAFKVCKELGSIHFDEGLQRIGGAAFFGCTALKEVKLPERLEDIGQEAFRGCKALAKVELSDRLLLSINPSEVFVGCPCEDDLNARRDELAKAQVLEAERLRVEEYYSFFNEMFGAVMVGDNLNYPTTYRNSCESLMGADITATDEDKLERLYHIEDNKVSDVGRGCMDVQFSNYNRKHGKSLAWEGLNKECLASIANKVTAIGKLDDAALSILDDLWRQFRKEVCNLNLRQVFARMIVSLRPDLTVPIVHPEAINEFYGWFVTNKFIVDEGHIGGGLKEWLKRWIIQNNRIKRFLTACLKRDKYEIGPFVWYFVEAFREEEQVCEDVRNRKELIRRLIKKAGYRAPDNWKEEVVE